MEYVIKFALGIMLTTFSNIELPSFLMNHSVVKRISIIIEAVAFDEEKNYCIQEWKDSGLC